MTMTQQPLGTFDDILAALRDGREVKLEIPWFLEDDGRHPLTLIREEGDRLVFFDPLGDEETAEHVGQFVSDGLTPPRRVEPGGYFSLETAELLARFERGDGTAELA